MAVGRLPEGDGEAGIVAEINITPLTDIFLVLLIIFMVTSSAMLESGPQVNLPEVADTTSESRGVVVTVEASNAIFIDGEPVARDALSARLSAALAAADVKRVVLEGDRAIALGEVVFILDEAKRAGATEVAIAARRP
ncbi:MAG: biopolymer transporter ExbD [Deltaproteobacteria bacterium]